MPISKGQISLAATAIVAMLASEFGFLIYGSLYWSRINSFFTLVMYEEGCFLDSLPLLSLETWLTTLIVPGIAPAVCAIAIVKRTTPERCETSKLAFIRQATTSSSRLYPVWENYSRAEFGRPDWQHSTWFDDWFAARCNRPHAILWIFIGFFFYVVLVVFCVLIYVWTKKKPELE
jgi:hypothetical protein